MLRVGWVISNWRVTGCESAIFGFAILAKAVSLGFNREVCCYDLFRCSCDWPSNAVWHRSILNHLHFQRDPQTCTLCNTSLVLCGADDELQTSNSDGRLLGHYYNVFIWLATNHSMWADALWQLTSRNLCNLLLTACENTWELLTGKASVPSGRRNEGTACWKTK